MDKYDIQMLKEVILVSIGVAAVFILMFSLTFSESSESKRFEVVDEYKGCDVVQYYHQGRATYSYFLHCHEGAAPRP